MKVSIQTIPHGEHRYPTCGDWWWEGETLQIRVSEVPVSGGGWKTSMCVAIHELTEALLCADRGIHQEVVDAFDMSPVGRAEAEPGEHIDCPYRREHRAAGVPEHFLLDALDLDEQGYNDALAGLYLTA